MATATKTSAQIAQRSVRSSTMVRTYAPMGTVIAAATHRTPVRARSITRRAGGTNGPASANSRRSATGTATAGPYSAASDGDRMSAEPKPEKPRTTPASNAAPIAAANVAERRSRLAPPAWTTAPHRRSPDGSADEARLQGHAAAAVACGGEAAGAPLLLADRRVLHRALDLCGAGGGEVVVEDGRVHESHGALRRPFAHRANAATCRPRSLSCGRRPLSRSAALPLTGRAVSPAAGGLDPKPLACPERPRGLRLHLDVTDEVASHRSVPAAVGSRRRVTAALGQQRVRHVLER